MSADRDLAHSLTRRELLRGALAAALSALAAPGCARAGVVPYANLDAAARVGERWLAAQVSAPSAEALARSLFGDASDPAAQRDALVQRHGADLAAGNFARVDGWLLSESEARACALAALLEAG